eukprot:m.56561 g.56561  ORF g.56561 m.56561 type:complete len:56 (-) comp16988_c0_seq1:326-493(-)
MTQSDSECDAKLLVVTCPQRASLGYVNSRYAYRVQCPRACQGPLNPVGSLATSLT